MNKSFCFVSIIVLLGRSGAFDAQSHQRHPDGYRVRVRARESSKESGHIEDQHGFDQSSQDVKPEEEVPFYPIKSFTTKFSLYDVNKDGHVTLRELIHVTGRASHVRKAFQASDLNGDGVVSKEEYDQVPWGYTNI